MESLKTMLTVNILLWNYCNRRTFTSKMYSDSNTYTFYRFIAPKACAYSQNLNFENCKTNASKDIWILSTYQ